MMPDMYLVPRTDETREERKKPSDDREKYDVVIQDFGLLSDPEGDSIRVLMVEPGVNTCRECIWSFRQRPDGTLYQVQDEGSIIEFDLLTEAQWEEQNA